MKILFVGSDSQLCGAGLSMLQCITELERLGLDVVPVVHQGYTEQALAKQLKKHYIVNSKSWIVYRHISPLKQFLIILAKRIWNIYCYWQYIGIIRKENPDIVHVNVLTTYSIVLAALHEKKPIVWHIREMIEEDFNGRFWNPEKAHSLMKKVTTFIAISQCVKRKYEIITGPNKIKCIYNGIDTDTFLNRQHRILQQSPIVLTLAGRIHPSKGQLACLQDLTVLLKTNNQIVLQFAGAGSDEHLREISKFCSDHGLNNKQVKLLGKIADMRSLWGNTDIAIVYSKFEAFGRVTVEAQMSGVIVVGYNSGGTSELISDGKNGYLFGNGYNKLSDVIQRILSHPEKAQEIALAGRERAATVFTSQNNAKQILQVYQEILSR